MVADAAEHLERATIDKEVEHVQGTLGEYFWKATDGIMNSFCQWYM